MHPAGLADPGLETAAADEAAGSSPPRGGVTGSRGRGRRGWAPVRRRRGRDGERSLGGDLGGRRLERGYRNGRGRGEGRRTMGAGGVSRGEGHPAEHAMGALARGGRDRKRHRLELPVRRGRGRLSDGQLGGLQGGRSPRPRGASRGVGGPRRPSRSRSARGRGGGGASGGLPVRPQGTPGAASVQQVGHDRGGDGDEEEEDEQVRGGEGGGSARVVGQGLPEGRA